MLTDIFRGQRGMAPIVFAVTVVWALVAVLLLTGTLLAARDIDHQVKGSITPELGSINRNSELIKLTARTAKLTTSIRAAAAPLSSQLNTVIAAARTIDATAKSIGRHVGPINAHVRSIGSSVDSIGSTVGSINDVVHRINANVHAIDGTAAAIRARLRAVDGDVGSILSVASTINARGIVANADRIIGVAKPGILSDFDGILGYVGNGGAAANSANTVDGHANSIDCARLLNVGRRTAACGHSR